MTHRVLVLGGYGFFGERICAALANNPAIELFPAGRDARKASELTVRLSRPAENGVCVDAHSAELTDVLKRHRIDTVINTAGPFQNQDYHVPRGVIAAGSNYVDLADSREFVANIGALDAAAREAGVSVITGASSVPALTSAVIDRFASDFEQLDAVHIGIASGARTPGIATVRGIFSYCGKAFTRTVNGKPETTFGWLDLQRHRFPAPVGMRLLGSCDVPDLSILPLRYPTLNTVTFHAGFASPLGHLVVWALSALVKTGVLRSVVPFAPILNRIGTWIEPWVSDKGAMFVDMHGQGWSGERVRKTWNILALDNDGPHIPCGASIALANQLAAGESLPKGAMPCVGLVTLDEYLASLRDLHIVEVVQ